MKYELLLFGGVGLFIAILFISLPHPQPAKSVSCDIMIGKKIAILYLTSSCASRYNELTWQGFIVTNVVANSNADGDMSYPSGMVFMQKNVTGFTSSSIRCHLIPAGRTAVESCS